MNGGCQGIDNRRNVKILVKEYKLLVIRQRISRTLTYSMVTLVNNIILDTLKLIRE